MLRQVEPYDMEHDADLKREECDPHDPAGPEVWFSSVSGSGVVTALNEMARTNLKRAMEEICALLGARSYAIIRACPFGESEAVALASTMEPELEALFTNILSSGQNNVARNAAKSVLPFSWCSEDAPGDEPLPGKAGAAGERYDVLFRRSPWEGHFYCILEARRGSHPPHLEQLVMAQGLVQAVFEHLVKRDCVDDETASRITVRERECLRWCAEGKTSEEIGIILSLSTHTVNNYLISVTRKLNAVNRMHAITTAFRRGILSVDGQR